MLEFWRFEVYFTRGTCFTEEELALQEVLNSRDALGLQSYRRSENKIGVSFGFTIRRTYLCGKAGRRRTKRRLFTCPNVLFS